MSDKVIDPVCGMQVDPATSARWFEHKGTTYHFLQRSLSREIQKRSREFCNSHNNETGGGRNQRLPASRRGDSFVYVPDASRDPAGPSGVVSEMRDGA